MKRYLAPPQLRALAGACCSCRFTTGTNLRLEVGQNTWRKGAFRWDQCRTPLPRWASLLLAALMVQGTTSIALPAAATAPSKLRVFIDNHCVECHDADSKKGGLDLTSLEFDLESPGDFARWVNVHDRVASGEMPPKKKPRPSMADLRAFTNSLGSVLLQADL